VMGAESRHMEGYSFYHTVLSEVPQLSEVAGLAEVPGA
jgi:hypothetical protein